MLFGVGGGDNPGRDRGLVFFFFLSVVVRGMGCACIRTKPPRFKGFVVDAYPSDRKNDSPVQDTLGKLENYVASNPERIPRICRKISKLLAQDERRKHTQRILVGLKMLKELIVNSSEVSGFVPHSIDICARLLNQRYTAEIRIAVADVITALCFKVVGHHDREHSCHLLNHSKDRLLPPLLQMCMERLTEVRKSSDDSKAEDGGGGFTMELMRCHHAGVVALGNLAFCLQGALANSVRGVETAFLLNLLHAVSNGGPAMQEQQFSMLHAPDMHEFSASTSYNSNGGADGGPFRSVLLPDDRNECTAVRIAAAAWGIGAIASCVPSVNIRAFLQSVQNFITVHRVWSPPLFPCVVFRSLTHAMERRPQRLGFCVCKFLHDFGKEKAVSTSSVSKRERGKGKRGMMAQNTAGVLSGVLQALVVCVSEVRMIGRTPQILIDEWPTDAVLIDSSVVDGPAMEIFELHLKLVLRLLQCAYRWQNAPQLHQLLLKLLYCLQRVLSTSTQGPVVTVALQALAEAASYIRTVPFADRSELSAASFIEPYLQSSGSMRPHIARVLAGFLSGAPPSVHTPPDELAGVVKGRKVRETADSSTEQLEAHQSPLLTDGRDVATAKEWLLSVIGKSRDDNSDVSATCVVEVGRVMGALLQGCGAAELSFALAVADMLQSFASDTKKNTDLHVAWSHQSLVILVNCSIFCGAPQLYRYATELLEQRHNAGELSTHFCHNTEGDTIRLMRPKHGSQQEGGQANLQPLRTQPMDEPPVTIRVDMDVVINMVAENATEELMSALRFPPQDNRASKKNTTAVADRLKAAVADASSAVRHSKQSVEPRQHQQKGGQSTVTAGAQRDAWVFYPGILDVPAPEADGKSQASECGPRLSVIVDSEKIPAQDSAETTHGVGGQPLFILPVRERIAELLARHNVGPTTTLIPPGSNFTPLPLPLGVRSLHVDPTADGMPAEEPAPQFRATNERRVKQHEFSNGSWKRHMPTSSNGSKVVHGDSAGSDDADGASFSSISASSV